MSIRRPTRLIDPKMLRVLLAAALVILPGCLGSAFTPDRYELRSITNNTALRPRFITSVYAFDDQNTVNIFMTDLDPRDLRSPELGTKPTGHLVNIHLFLAPQAGRTPIDDTAMTATVTHIVLAAGEVGVYSGGGFFSPDTKAGNRTYSGSINAGTLRLERSSSRFRDLLGSSMLSLHARAQLDPAQAEALRIAMRRWVALATSD